MSTSDISGEESLSGAIGDEAKPANMNRQFLKRLGISVAIIAVVFWGNVSWLLGSYFHGSEYMYRAQMLVVDYDGSLVGQALLAAVDDANGPVNNPTYVVASAREYTLQEVKHAVFIGQFWGAIYASADATAQLNATLAGTNTSVYDVDAVYMLFGNSARYTAFYPSVVLDNLEAIANAAAAYFRQTLAGVYWEDVLTRNISQAQLGTFLRPLGYTYVDTSYGSFTFGDRTTFNTLMIVVVVLAQFFFLLALNNLSKACGRFAAVSTWDYFKWRLPLSLGWACFMGICLTSWQMIFREGYPINARLFWALWILYTVFSTIVFDVLDIITAFVPQQYIPYCMFTWMITNVSSAGSPVELSNAFYHISYFFPAHSMWLAEQHIWSQGGAYPLSLSLPILAAWLVVVKVCTIFTVKPRRGY
ncbi:hypothetical protein ASPZODRAFT_15496 [Penicilliopsis zonata CBS 506.65]|uniref:DUF3533 domain-containing protein n=1 Tax=Penicilliopsis zonata CBS 506.65 TaxID=1073090 RepID=A0A1L9SLT2_9EURO|nr:hypothetical protein ASPZODRAFT_15496 [Penicilliopsis zonata CBS 506.65]OJJ48051.1 hypothetical protein ASPZODRAFT_15496 [Penicilliopsis zonata CBS 506.65]